MVLGSASMLSCKIPLAYTIYVFSQALSEKELGNAAYKKKDFSTAIEHYNKAIELDPINVTFKTNKAGKCFALLFFLSSLNWAYLRQCV